MSGLQDLITSGFGVNACLYKDVLQCTPNATSLELRKSYHKRALRYHPDKYCPPKANNKKNSTLKGDEEEIRMKEATLKFQALSAAYQFLSNPSQRALYDSTGKIPSEFYDDDDSNNNREGSESRFGRKPENAAYTTYTTHPSKNDEWLRFFQSVVEEIIGAGANFDRAEYCGSQEEKDDVLHYYQLCKGNRSKMQSCIVQAQEEDYKRWWRDIISPAIDKGTVENFENIENMNRKSKKYSTADHSSTDKLLKPKMKKLLKKGKRKLNKISKSKQDTERYQNNGLEDTDDEEDFPPSPSSSTEKVKVMSRREKMEYRVAKKRKEKKEQEIEIASIMQSKQWTGKGVAAASKRRRNRHGLNESFLSGLEEKFSARDYSKNKRKKKR